MTDTRIAHGAMCAWWGPIASVGKRGGLPCCPHCKGMLYEPRDRATWEAGVTRYLQSSGDTAYRAYIAWLEGKCFPSNSVARAAYEASLATGGGA